MANYYASARTSYTKVKDPEKFKEWASDVPGVEVISQKGEGGTLYGLMVTCCDGAGWPCQKYIEETDDFEDLDVYGEFQEHVADGWCVTFKEVGAEKLRYLVGAVVVVTPDDIRHSCLDTIAAQMREELGSPEGTLVAY